MCAGHFSRGGGAGRVRQFKGISGVKFVDPIFDAQFFLMCFFLLSGAFICLKSVLLSQWLFSQKQMITPTPFAHAVLSRIFTFHTP
jgi:hypothetical protein